jgi:hypothetical protein
MGFVMVLCEDLMTFVLVLCEDSRCCGGLICVLLGGRDLSLVMCSELIQWMIHFSYILFLVFIH